MYYTDYLKLEPNVFGSAEPNKSLETVPEESFARHTYKKRRGGYPRSNSGIPPTLPGTFAPLRLTTYNLTYACLFPSRLP